MNMQKLDQWIFESFSVTPQGLGFFRVAAALFLLFFLIPDPSDFIYLSSLPKGFFSPPPGPMMFLNDFPPEWVFWTLYGLINISLWFVLAGYKTKPSSIVAGILILVLNGLIFSIGKINHNLLVGVLPIVMAFSNWGAAFSVDAGRGETENKVESWPLTLLALMIGFMMFTAGFPKILGGWLDPTTQATEAHFLNQFFTKERQALLAEYFFYISMDPVWELMDWATIVFEVGFLFAVLNSKWFKVFICVALIFHFSNLMVLNIVFPFNYVAYAAFLDWTKIFVKFRDWVENLRWQANYSWYREPVFFGGILFVMFAALNIISDANLVFQDSEILFHDLFFSIFSLFIVLYLGVRKIRRVRLNRTKVVYS